MPTASSIRVAVIFAATEQAAPPDAPHDHQATERVNLPGQPQSPTKLTCKKTCTAEQMPRGSSAIPQTGAEPIRNQNPWLACYCVTHDNSQSSLGTLVHGVVHLTNGLPDQWPACGGAVTNDQTILPLIKPMKMGSHLPWGLHRTV